MPEFIKAGLAIFENHKKLVQNFSSVFPLSLYRIQPAVYGKPDNSIYHKPKFICPVQGRITSHFGMRTDPIFEGTANHNGIDIAGRLWSPVKCTSAGTVLFAGNKPRWGNVVIVDHNESGYQTVYGHMQKIMTEKDQQVAPGQIIGFLGNTGKSTGPHLHYEIRFLGKPLDPLPLLLPEDAVVD